MTASSNSTTQSRPVIFGGSPGSSRKAASRMGNPKMMTATCHRKSPAGIAKSRYENPRSAGKKIRHREEQAALLSHSPAAKPKNQSGANNSPPLAKANGKRRPREAENA